MRGAKELGAGLYKLYAGVYNNTMNLTGTPAPSARIDTVLYAIVLVCGILAIVSGIIALWIFSGAAMAIIVAGINVGAALVTYALNRR